MTALTTKFDRRARISRRPTCEAKVLVWAARFDTGGVPGVAECDRAEGHTTLFHEGPIESHDLTTRISWLDTDRRTFRGQLSMCTYVHCTLPWAHPGDHAL